MLQIATGRFFKSADIKKHLATSAFFGNTNIFHDLQTPIGLIRTAAAPKGCTGYVHEYVQHYQVLPSVWVWGGDEEIAEQLTALLTVFLPGFFDRRQDTVEAVCKIDPSGIARDESLPSNFVERKTRPPVANLSNEVRETSELLSKLVELPRPAYERLVAAALTFKRGIMALGQDHELAYSMLVFALEALSGGKELAPSWTDLPARDRQRYERTFQGLPTPNVEELRAAILEERHLRLMHGFVDFVTKRLPEDFFTTKAKGIESALRPSIIADALRNAYAIRSKFAHELEIVSSHLRVPQITTGETFQWDGQTYVTFRGLVRILETVFRQIILETPPDPDPKEDWHSLIPGTIIMKVGHESALPATKTLPPRRGPSFYSAVVSQFWFRKDKVEVADLRAAFRDGKQHLANLTAEDRLCLYWSIFLYSHFLRKDLHDEWWATFLVDHEPKDTWHALVAVTLLDGRLDSDLEDQEKMLNELENLNGQKSGADVPVDAVTAAGVLVANASVENGDVERQKRILSYAKLELSARFEAQQMVDEAIRSVTAVDLGKLRKVILGL